MQDKDQDQILPTQLFPQTVDFCHVKVEWSFIPGKTLGTSIVIDHNVYRKRKVSLRTGSLLVLLTSKLTFSLASTFHTWMQTLQAYVLLVCLDAYKWCWWLYTQKASECPHRERDQKGIKTERLCLPEFMWICVFSVGPFIFLSVSIGQRCSERERGEREKESDSVSDRGMTERFIPRKLSNAPHKNDETFCTARYNTNWRSSMGNMIVFLQMFTSRVFSVLCVFSLPREVTLQEAWL